MPVSTELVGLLHAVRLNRPDPEFLRELAAAIRLHGQIDLPDRLRDIADRYEKILAAEQDWRKRHLAASFR